MLNRWLWRSLALLALVAGASGTGYFVGAQGAEKQPEKPKRTLRLNEVARIGPRVITAEQVIARISDSEFLIQDERFKVLTNSVNYLVYVNLLGLEAERVGCEIKPSEIDLETRRQVAELKKLVTDRYGGAVPWEEWLKSQGMNEERLVVYFTARVKTVLLKRLIVNYFETSTESYECAHILLKTKAAADEIWTRLNRGGNWEDIAVKESQDLGSANMGGKLPRHYKGDGLVAEVANAVYGLKDGEYSAPVKTQYGFHVVKRVKTNLANAAKFFDRRSEFLAYADVDDDRFNRWVRVVLSRNEYQTEYRVPGIHCDPDMPIKD